MYATLHSSAAARTAGLKSSEASSTVRGSRKGLCGVVPLLRSGLQNLVRRPPPAKLHTASSFRNLPHMWLTAVRLSNNQVFIGPECRSAVAVLPYVRPIPGRLLPTVAVVFPTFKNFSSPKIIKDSNKSHTPPPYSNKRSLAHITLSNSINCSN